MPPLEWDKVMSAKPDGLSEEDIDTFYEQLADFEASSETDAEKLKKLFAVTKSVMKSKHQQGEEVMEEFEKEAKVAKRREKELQTEKDKLDKRVAELEKFGPETGGAAGGGAARAMREELHELTEQNDNLRQEAKDVQRDLSNEKRAAEKYSERISELEKELKDLRDDNDQMRQDISDYKLQMQSQRDNLVARRGEDVEYRDKLSRKNKDLAEAMEELQNLTDANDLLQKRVDDLQGNLEDAIQQMDRTTEDYMKLKHVLQQSDAVTDRLREENEMLKAQVLDLNEQVQSKTDADDAIMVAVNNKVEEWKILLSEKDQAIMELQEQVFRLRDQLIAANMDGDKASVGALSKVVKEKDNQIEELTEQIKGYVEEMETNTAIIDDLREELQKTGHGPGDRQHQRIKELQIEVKSCKDRYHEYEKELKLAVSDAAEKDKELGIALERLRKLEAGVYGLTEAVAEIKEGKTQIKVRDRQLEELTQHVNQAEIKLNDMAEENEDLRQRLGIDPSEPIDLAGFRKQKVVKKQEERALNLILQKEIERLEEERIELKQKIRKLAQQTGQRAVALGLTADDMVALQDFTEDLKFKPQTVSVGTRIRQEVQQEDGVLWQKELNQDYKDNLQEVEKLYRENADVRAKNEQLNVDIQLLEAAYKEVAGKMSEASASGKFDQAIQFPAVERMLAAIEAKGVIGKYDTSLALNAEVHNLQGRNEELRSAMTESRHEANKCRLELDKALEKLEKMELDLKAAHEPGAGSLFQGKPLPENIAVSSAEVISSLNEHLIISLQELATKEEKLKKNEESLDNFRRKFAIMRHQQGLVYQDYLTDRKALEEEVKKYKEKFNELDGRKDEDGVRLQEYDRLLDTLSKDDVEVRRRLSEMSRRITVLRVNEKALTRRFNIMEESELQLRKEVKHHTEEMVAMEMTVTERIGYLQRYKDMATFKITAYQKSLGESVSASDLEMVNKKHIELTEKYRDLLEKGNTLVVKADAITGLEGEVKSLSSDNEELKKTLSVEKEKLHALESTMEELHRRGVADVTEITDAHVISISKKVTTLEMKELNERQRAEHAVAMYDKLRESMQAMEKRNEELENKFSDITKSNLELQRIERNLRDELSDSVTKSVSDADRKRITELEENEVNLKMEISKLKEVSEVASTQVQTLETQQISRDKEMLSLRQQLLDFQVQSDEKTIIGKLHRHIVLLQISEGTALRKLNETQKKVIKLEAQVLRIEQRLDDKNQTIFHNRTEAHSKATHLKRNLYELRLQFAGAVPLSKQEKFSHNMMKLQEDKNRIQAELKDAQNNRNRIEDRMAEYELQNTTLQELIVTLKDGRGAAKVMEWHSKMDGLRLEDMKLKRHGNKLNQQIKYLEGIIRSHEVTISDLEAENVNLTKECDNRQLRWEQREVELERTIATLERNAAEITGAASQFEEALGNLPNSKLPVANQLEQAISTIKSNVKVILDTQAESKALKERTKQLEKKLRDAEHSVLTHEKLVSELRLRMPATAERDNIIMQATSKVSQASPRDLMKQDYESEQSMRIAQSTISSLQARIQQKEETISKYQELLKHAREDMQEMNRRHEQELVIMQEKIHMSTDAAFSKFRETAQELLAKKTSQPLSNKQLVRVGELEDQVAEQNNTMIAMTQKLRQREEENTRLRAQIKLQERKISVDVEKLLEEQKTMIAKKESEVDGLNQRLEQQHKEIELLTEEVESLKETNKRAPTSTMKNLVESLRNQLALKEKQHQALSKALTELRADMVTQAQEQVKHHAEEASQGVNIQKLINKHTRELSEQIEDLNNDLDRHKKEVKKKKNDLEMVKSELEDLKDEMSRKDRSIKKLKNDKQCLEEKVLELEKKITRMNTMRSQHPDEAKQDLEEAKRHINLLEQELKYSQQRPEKPYEQKVQDPVETSKKDDLLKWEESKKWQKTVDKMKSKIKEKEMEIGKLEKGNKTLKDQTDRLTREKTSLEMQLKKVSGSSVMPSRPPEKMDHHLEILKAENYQLKEEVTTLQRQLTMGKEVAFEEVQLRNRHLTEQLEDMTRAVTSQKMMAEAPSGTMNVMGSSQYQELFDKNQNLQRQILKLSEENIELRFDLEQSGKEAPRLKERISDLQKYVEALKLENAQLAGTSTNRSSASSGLRRIGESGKNTRELEKTVALLKKVVERVQSENEQLKKAPEVANNKVVQSIKVENEGLKIQLDELRHNMGATLSERYLSNQKGTAKIMANYEALRKDFEKEVERNEKLGIRIRHLESEKNQLSRNLEGSKSKIEMEEAKRPGAQAMDMKGWGSAVVTRMYESKMKTIDGEMEKKNQELADTKTLLKESTYRQQQLVMENNKLNKNIHMLEQYPQGGTDRASEAVRDIQHARLKIERLENEKKELLHELGLLRKANGTATVPLDDDIMTKAMSYDRIMEENINLSMEIKAVALERDKLMLELERLKKELQNFSPEFFEEIEDLKYNYKQAVEKNVLYEEKLAQISEQFGLSLGIPGV